MLRGKDQVDEEDEAVVGVAGVDAHGDQRPGPQLPGLVVGVEEHPIGGACEQVDVVDPVMAASPQPIEDAADLGDMGRKVAARKGHRSERKLRAEEVHDQRDVGEGERERGENEARVAFARIARGREPQPRLEPRGGPRGALGLNLGLRHWGRRPLSKQRM